MPISLKNATSILSWIRYSPQENNMLIAGDDGKPRDISFLGRSFAIDVENGSMGWLLISEGMRDWKPFAIDAVTPPSPGPSYERGFSILFYAPKLLGSPEAFEMCASTAAHLSFCERLYNEAEPQFGKGTVPSRSFDAVSVSFLRASRSILSCMMRRSNSSNSSGLESTCIRWRAAASSIKSIALSGRNRSAM
jgi:hypothetical protein